MPSRTLDKSARQTQLEVERILRVDHAGECGAVCIYTAQIRLAQYLWPQCVPALREMLGHEQTHLLIFAAALQQRGARNCYALPLWRLGGSVLGLVTALLGPKAIWACTAAVEHTVNHHLQEQLVFLQQHDNAALQAVQAIVADEQAHLEHAFNNGGHALGTNRLIWALVSNCTTLAIWLSRRL